MILQDYYQRLEQRRAQENLALICLHQKHEDIAEEVNLMLNQK
jgi:hypothetical protein